MTICYIGLGSNLSSPTQQLAKALIALSELPTCRLQATSPWYRSVAVGPGRQPDYLNAVARISTTSEAETLLSQLQGIERRQGRQRTIRWGPRTLDLDLLLFGGYVIDLPDLRVPHPRLLERNFVLFPLLDLEPALTLPDGTALQPAAKRLGQAGLIKLDDQGPQPLHQPQLQQQLKG